MMAWLVPYVINGAAHSAALFRRQAQRPATDQTGVARPGDLKVTQLPAAADGVRIAQGGLALASRFPGRDRESYGVENGDSSIDVTGLTGTGSAARRDAVVVEVIDPNYLTGEWTHDTAAPLNYMKVHVVEGVAAAAKDIDGVPEFRDRTAYVLAFINWPENQTSVQDSYIEDARSLASPMREMVTRNYELVGAETSEITSATPYPDGATWPKHTEVDPSWSNVPIPKWATRMRIVMTWSGVLIPAGQSAGWVWVQVGLNVNPDRVVTQGRKWTSTREGWRATGTVAVPESMRGTLQGFFPRATRTSGSAADAPVLDSASGMDLLVEFFNDTV